MSYILDALKKAEADRNPDARASLAIEQRERRRQRLLAYFVVAALLTNAVVLLWLFVPESEPEMGTATVSESVPSRTATPEMTPAEAAPIPTETPASRPQSTAIPASPEPAASEPAFTAIPARPTPEQSAPGPASGGRVLQMQDNRPVTLNGLPDNVRRRFPTLEFSTHIYADDPELRAIVVNGSRLLEGDRLGAVTVAEITEDGAIFSFEQYSVAIGVLEGWE